MKKQTILIGISFMVLLYSNPISGQEQLCKYGKSIDLEYLFDDGTIKDICLNEGSFTIGVFLTTEGNGILTLTIPRNVFDLRNPDCTDKNFIVSGDLGDPKVFETKTTKDSRTIEIHYTSQEVREYLVITTDVMIGKPYKFGSDCSIKEIIPSPNKQIKMGIDPNDVTCKDGLQLIFKYDKAPACVKPRTAEKLIERGWALE
ncbi:MAG: hypothetical protein ACREAL_07100 [Nitrosopumilaceae archaeon]